MHYAYSELHDFNKQNEVADLMKLVGLHIDTDDNDIGDE
jgi:hypothetical protein